VFSLKKELKNKLGQNFFQEGQVISSAFTRLITLDAADTFAPQKFAFLECFERKKVITQAIICCGSFRWVLEELILNHTETILLLQ
jgi:hypothetical protein